MTSGQMLRPGVPGFVHTRVASFPAQLAVRVYGFWGLGFKGSQGILGLRFRNFGLYCRVQGLTSGNAMPPTVAVLPCRLRLVQLRLLLPLSSSSDVTGQMTIAHNTLCCCDRIQ